ncbi:TauD/TfdA dioxygenase family protein [Novosphingobium mangrovi (ex Huang et al. 2023)]|uniref:TauD/TfdA family dioxygenase n=1 Tax=Novosphingobium mangrovi (ex Huang et al. 2023) TaxID=2976432 RepID=A0ABT2I543_9SPHN|nr:TauD/TfdA family dioxygenase [Novosphingobium mangrovi (ex Huang et al. 2023)]MCT2399932.1 TauD/TfdA family dioxygenase [Novosphingobium mangrovi (ex Huang et al. 2023)]
MAIEAVDLTPAIGSKIIGSPENVLQPETAAQLRKLLVERGVLVFPELNLTDEQQVQLADMMGNLRSEGEKGIFKVTLDGGINAKAEYLKGSWLWHMDGTHDDVPVFASLLTGRVLSKEGGQTGFANSYAAYEALSPEMKARLEGLKVVHSFATSMSRADVSPTAENVAYWRSIPDKTHSLVWPHKSGRKSLVIGCHASHVVGMDRKESDALLAELLDWVTQPQFTYWHQWKPGDLLIWDNTGVLHRARPYPLDSGRVMHRTTLLGEEAFA